MREGELGDLGEAVDESGSLAHGARRAGRAWAVLPRPLHLVMYATSPKVGWLGQGRLHLEQVVRNP